MGRCYQFLVDSGKNPEIFKDLKEEAEHLWYIIRFPRNGTKLHMKHGCDDCSTYYIGDHRCSCGNQKCYVASDLNGRLSLDDTSVYYYVENC